MMLGKIPKKNSVSMNCPLVSSPLLPESPAILMKPGGCPRKQKGSVGGGLSYQAWQREQKRLEVTSVPEKKRTVLKVGLKGGALVGLGKNFASGKMLRKGSKWTVDRSKTTDFYFLGFQKLAPVRRPAKAAPQIIKPVAPVPAKIRVKITQKPAAKLATIVVPKPQAVELYWTPEYARKIGVIFCTHLFGKKIQNKHKK